MTHTDLPFVARATLCPDTIPCETCSALVNDALAALHSCFGASNLDEWEMWRQKAAGKFRKAHPSR